MVHLTRIYTKTGDEGTTSLGDGSRTSKNDPRLEAFATVDEANSHIGVVVSLAPEDRVKEVLMHIQNDMFDVGADLCRPVAEGPEPLRVKEEQITYLEAQIDFFNKDLEPLKTFVLPTGTHQAALLHGKNR